MQDNGLDEKNIQELHLMRYNEQPLFNIKAHRTISITNYAKMAWQLSHTHLSKLYNH